MHGLARKLFFELMHDTVIVRLLTSSEDLVTVHDDAHEAVVKTQPEVQHWQRRLGGDCHCHLIGYRQFVRSEEFLSGEKQRGEFSQPGLVRRAAPCEERMAFKREPPQPVWNGSSAQRPAI